MPIAMQADARPPAILLPALIAALLAATTIVAGSLTAASASLARTDGASPLVAVVTGGPAGGVNHDWHDEVP